MNGLNHIGQNSIYEWLFEQIGGIQIAPGNPGWQKFRIAPLLFEAINHAEATLDSPCGKIICRTEKKKDGSTQLNVTVPPNKTAEVVLTGWSVESITENGQPVTALHETETFGNSAGKAIRITIPAGVYVFHGKINKKDNLSKELESY